MGKLAKRVAIVTGGARGMGAATARLLVAEGAHVIIADLLEAEGTALANELGDSARFVKLDATDEAGWQKLVADTVATQGTIDILVNNAGVVHSARIEDIEKGDFERVLGINVLGPWLGIKAVAKTMTQQGKGSIVNICSTAGLVGMNGVAAYSTSKWALRGLTKNAAMELGHRGVRVNAVFPGGVNTVMGNITQEPVDELAKYYQDQPIRRIGEPEEIARATLFLASDDASYICGAEIYVDGGMTLGTYSHFLPGAPEPIA
ncbi:MAG: glucose 1-dehydrogenase [Tissierellales bacterium]